MGMTPKERILAAIRGKETDRIPWSPFLTYWWEAQSNQRRAMGEAAFLKSIGADPLIRGHYPGPGKEGNLVLFYQAREKCETREETRGRNRRVIHETPVGVLEERYQYVEEGNTWFLVEHPVKTKEDFKILSYMMEHTQLRPDYSGFDQLVHQYGEEALFVPMLPPEGKSSFQALLEHWVGTEELVYDLMDFEDTVLDTLDAMRAISRKAAYIAAASSAEVLISWEDTSTTNISPSFFRDYILPEINEWCNILHEGGKLFMHHACGHMKDLMELEAQSGVDCLESLSPPPTGNIELWDARAILPGRISLIGGIEPTVFLYSSQEQLMGYVRKLCQNMRGTPFVLANSDSCPPGVSIEKLRGITDLVKKL